MNHILLNISKDLSKFT